MTPHDAKALVPVASSAVPALLAPDLDKAADLARQEKAKATRRAYRSDFAVFEAWCAGRGVIALPATAESVAAFLACEVDRGMVLNHRPPRCCHPVCPQARRPCGPDR